MYRRLIRIFLSAGMSTPEIRGMDRVSFCPRAFVRKERLTLLLLVFSVRADHAQDALAANDLAVLTDASHAAAHFHDSILKRRSESGESGLISVIRRKFKSGPTFADEPG